MQPATMDARSQILVRLLQGETALILGCVCRMKTFLGLGFRV